MLASRRFAGRLALLIGAASLILFTASCSRQPAMPWAEPSEFEPFDNLRDWKLFVGDGHTQEPAAGVIPYDLNSPLFSDYTAKRRFVKLPTGKKAAYNETEAFDFPVGSIIIKTFSMPADLRDPSKGERLLETRLLVHRPDGWIGLPYVWNEAQTEAKLKVAGGTVDVEWTHYDGGKRTNNYILPNVNQCKNCHENDRKILPIGPKARNLNRDFAYSDGTENQLVRWTKSGILEGAPPPDQAPKLAVWNDPKTGSLDERARSWLEINCAHCHNPKGPARTSGLELMASVSDPVRWGLMKLPIAAGRGSGGRHYDIVPGKPDESILVFRLESTDPGVMMPELPRRLVDDEGVALIREWIGSMKPTSKPKPKQPPRG